MRAWGNRGDTVVIDEPLYAHYLEQTGLAHPMADEVVAAHETDWRRVVAQLTGPVPDGQKIFYQKHMAQHLLDDIELEWIAGLRNFLLIRDPVEVLPSFSRHYDDPTPADTGLPQQVRLFEWLTQRSGQPPPVVDAQDVLGHPEAMLTALCTVLGVPFDPSMLSWPPGRRATDGVWAPAWYERVEQSTHFAPYRPPTDPLPDHLVEVAQTCRPLYEQLHRHRLRPPTN